jgi:hypothetical protein
MEGPRCVHPFICWWTSELFLPLSCCELHCHEYLCKFLGEHLCFQFSWMYI